MTRPITIAYQAQVLSQNARAVLQGIAKYVRFHRDCHLRLTYETVDKVVPILKECGVDGAIVSPRSEAEERLVASCGLPCILTHTTAPQKVLPYLTANNRLLGQMAANHFIDKGFTNFAFFSLDNHRFWTAERLDGFRTRVEQTGHIVHVFEPLHADTYPKAVTRRTPLLWPTSSWIGNAERLVHWMQSLPKPVGVMATDDGAGYDIIEASEEAGVRVPEELAVLSTYNDPLQCLLSNPPLSSIAVDMERNGYDAAALLHRIVDGQEKMSGQRLLNEPTHIVARQSTDILAVSDPEVARALHFIKMNLHRPIQVADVVNETCISRRALEIRFREYVKRSIAEEITRVKVDQVTCMLLESDMSVERIADTLGFGSANRMRMAFKSLKGVNPLAFRMEHRVT